MRKVNQFVHAEEKRPPILLVKNPKKLFNIDPEWLRPYNNGLFNNINEIRNLTVLKNFWTISYLNVVQGILWFKIDKTGFFLWKSFKS